MEKANAVPIHKKKKVKSDKQLLIDYRQVSLLPICGKVFERIIFTKKTIFFLHINQVLSREIRVSNNL